MKKIALKNIMKRFFCWILLLQMINISIDLPDAIQLKNSPITNREDLSINKIESIYELISEEIFHKDVPESDENDTDTFIETLDPYYFSSNIFSNVIVPEFPVKHNRFEIDEFLAHYPEPNSPPPKKA